MIAKFVTIKMIFTKKIIRGAFFLSVTVYFSTTTSMDDGIDKCLRYDHTIQ